METENNENIGVSFSGNENKIYMLYSFLWLSSVIITFSLVELYEVYVYLNNLDVLVNNLSYLGTDLLGIAKVTVLLYYRLRIGKTLDNMEKGLFAANKSRGGSVEEKLIKDCILINNRQTCLYYLAVVTVVSLGAFGTILKRLYGNSEKWEMPFMTFSLFNTNTSPAFEIVWFHQFWWRLFYALIVSSADALIAGILAHISIQCKILQNAITNTISNAHNEVSTISPCKVRNDEELLSSQIPPNILAKHLKDIVDYHLAIIDLAIEFEQLFNILILTIFLATLFILCFIMYHASLFDLLSIRAAQDFSYVALVALQVFLYCYWGNEVRLESEKVVDACWNMDFVGTDTHFQKGLSLVIRRSQKPIVLTAGKFTDLSLKTYVWIIRASYSYYMVLRNHNGN